MTYGQVNETRWFDEQPVIDVTRLWNLYRVPRPEEMTEETRRTARMATLLNERREVN